MPRIPVKRDSVDATPRGPNVPVSNVSGVAGLQGRETQRLGAILSNFGGNIGDLAIRMQNIAIDNEANEAVTKFSEEMNARLPEIMKESPEKWADQYDNEAGKWRNNQRYRYKAAQDRADLQIRRHVSNEKVSLAINGWRAFVAKEKGSLESRMVGSVRDGDPQRFEEMLTNNVANGVLTEQDKQYWIGRYAAHSAETQAFEALKDNPDQKQALKDAKKILSDNVDVLKGNPDRSLKSIENELENEAAIRKLQNKQADNTMVLKTVDEFFPSVTSRSFTIRDIEAKMPQLQAVEGGAWKEIADGLAQADPEKTDWKAYVKAQDMIQDIWAGRQYSTDESSEKGNLSLKTKLAKLYAADKKFTPETWAEINYYTGQKVEPEKLNILDKGFKEISKMYNTVWLSNSEARDIASARRAYFEWMQYNTNRKKDISIEQAVTEGRKLMVSHKTSQYEVGETREVNGQAWEYIGDGKWQAK
jgi:hypothetical protein